MDVLWPVILAFLAGSILIPLVQLLLCLLIGRRRERPWKWRDALTRGLDSWKSPLVGLFIGTATLACGFSGVNANVTGPRAQLVPIWIVALVFLTQVALPFVAGMIASTYALARWGRTSESSSPPRRR